MGYKLIPAVVALWEDALNPQKDPEMFVAYTFQASEATNEHINPVPGYFNFLQRGLELFGEDFEVMWWATTYLADQKTVVKKLPYGIIDLGA